MLPQILKAVSCVHPSRTIRSKLGPPVHRLEAFDHSLDFLLGHAFMHWPGDVSKPHQIVHKEALT